ncbi:MAG: class I SAM-dependent methyltransferase [Oscillibacter sp.]|nr:class I SAM-dependent methyltransferase [Oscillibacter sp.]
MTNEQYKALSVKEFDRAAAKYESGHAGVYELCKKDYPPILEELEKEPFETLLDCGCGTAPMLSLLSERYPERRYTGIDLSPNMIAAARAKGLKNASFVLGDCERLPFADNSFDAVICSQSFHHYPDPQSFFNSASSCCRLGSRPSFTGNSGRSASIGNS